MRVMKYTGAAMLAWLVGACGGGGSGTASGTTYPYVIPALNAQSQFGVTYVDNTGNTIALTVQDTVTAVNTDGTYVIHVDNPNNNSLTVNATTYAILTEDDTLSISGQTLSYAYTPSGGSLVTCIDAPHGPGPDFPVTLGLSWTNDFTVACGAGTPIAYSQNGSVLDLESITVPAGTFTALKLQSSVVWTTAAGIVRTEMLTTWRDASTGRVIKEVNDLSYSTPPANGNAVAKTTVLLSRS
jgi:hypothetical protein